MSAPQNRIWNQSCKTQESTYRSLALGVKGPLTDKKIEHYRRNGFYGEAARLAQLEEDKMKGRKIKAPRERADVLSMIDDLAD